MLWLETRSALPGLWSVSILLLPLALAIGLRGKGGLRGDGRAARRVQQGAWLALACGAGFHWAAGHATLRTAHYLPSGLEGQDIRLVGVVASLPEPTERGGRFEFDVERVITAGATVPPHISLNWYRIDRSGAAIAAPAFHAGERWELTVRLRRPHGTVNPHGFDVELWALEHNLRAVGHVRPDGENRRLTDFVARPGYLVERARESIRERFVAVLGDAPYAPVLMALAIGDQTSVPQSQWKTFWRTGVGHLISISGLHITMVASLAAWLAGWTWRRTGLSLHVPARKIAVLAGLMAALIYSLLAGFSVPTQRTLYMIAVAALALWFDRIGSPSRVLALALLVVLLFDPWAILSPGFWLSFGAVAVIFYATTNRAHQEGMLAAAVRTQVAVSLGLLPLLLGLFQQVSLVSPLANAFAIPVVSFLIVPLTLLGAVLPVDAFLHLAHWLMSLCAYALDWLAAWPSATWESHAPPVWTIVLSVAGVAWLLAPRGLPSRWVGALWLAPLFLLEPARPAPGEFWMTALDVGQGLAVAVRTQSHALLYDTGPRWSDDADSGSRVVVPYLRGEGIGHLDGVVVSHADSDHSGGAISVLDSVPTGWLLSSLPDDSPILKHSDRRLRCHAGQRWEWDGVAFAVLHPALPVYAEANRKTNDRSCVIKVTSRFGSALLTADIEALSEGEILARDAGSLRSDVLVVPHHGSRTSSTEAFVSAVGPRLSIFTVGYRNTFGHPRPEIVARYESSGSRILRSDRSGAIQVKLDESGIQATEWRESARRYWYDD